MFFPPFYIQDRPFINNSRSYIEKRCTIMKKIKNFIACSAKKKSLTVRQGFTRF